MFNMLKYDNIYHTYVKSAVMWKSWANLETCIKIIFWDENFSKYAQLFLDMINFLSGWNISLSGPNCNLQEKLPLSIMKSIPCQPWKHLYQSWKHSINEALLPIMWLLMISCCLSVRFQDSTDLFYMSRAECSGKDVIKSSASHCSDFTVWIWSQLLLKTHWDSRTASSVKMMMCWE